MADTTKIGSSEWWAGSADKLIDFGLGVLGTKLLGGGTTSGENTTPTKTVTAGSNFLPFAILGVIGVGIVVILAKR